MSEYNYTCACCGKYWHSTSTGPKPTKAEIARMVCQPCRDASKRIAALEAENAALREEVKEQDEREAKWAKRFDQQIGHYAVRLYNVRKRPILIARRRISALRAELAEAVRLQEKYHGALQCANAAAGRRGERLWNLSQQNAALLEDKARLVEALEKAVEVYGRPGGPWNVPSEPGAWLAQARAAIDAVRKEAPDAAI